MDERFTTKPNTALAGRADSLKRLSDSYVYLTDLLPPRCTARQVSGFLLLAYLQAIGRSPTLTELVEFAGDDSKGIPVLGASYERVLSPFMRPAMRDPGATGWIMQIEDEYDRRRKMLALTAKGRAVALTLADAIEGE